MSLKMNILLTNDDGVHFPGILAVKEVFEEHGHNVFIFAPAREKSATSQAMTIYDSIFVKPLEKNIFLVDGFPTDCVNIALHGELTSVTFDLVISGINKGVNMGYDTWYSGTVGAARHAFVHGYSAIAVSSGNISPQADFHSAANWLYAFLMRHEEILKTPTLLNINIPSEINAKIDAKTEQKKNESDIKWTQLGERIYRDKYKREVIGDGSYIFTMKGTLLGHRDHPMSDFVAYEANYISVTPLKLDATDYEKLEHYNSTIRK